MFLILLAFISFVLTLAFLAMLGMPLLTWAIIEVTGYRPTDWVFGLCYIPYLASCLAVALVVLGLLIWLFRPFILKTTARKPSLLEVIMAGIPVLAVLGLLGWQFVWPHAGKLLRAERWPQQLYLASFRVDARDIEFGSWGREYAQGVVEFEITNYLPGRITEATFTLEWTPHKRSRFAVRDLAPGERRTVQREEDFGNIMVSPGSGDMPGTPQRCTAVLYCDRLRVADNAPVSWGPPPPQRKVVIGDAPRVSIAGFWIGTTGEQMNLAQKGIFVAGAISGGVFSSYPNPL